MSQIALSVVLPTRNRHEKFAALLADLRDQSLAPENYEIVVVDDGSTPPVVLPESKSGPPLQLVRLEGVERCIGRNSGVARAKGEVVLFVDDDLRVGRDFLAQHLAAHEQFSNAMVIGEVNLPDSAQKTPFGAFRARMEKNDTPQNAGSSQNAAFATAQSLSLSAARFAQLGGFDGAVLCIEDQDLAARHLALQSGETRPQMVFWPAAMATHFDNALDIRAYFRRSEYGARWLPAFCRRYPDWPSSRERMAINGPLHPGRESPRRTLWKIGKSVLALPPLPALLLAFIERLEKIAPSSPLLPALYRLMIGIALQKGFRRGGAVR